ncbi:MAG: S9 family peptidase [Clostridia bacterium]|nr:S9 family peptidase [Clostridia bacterium]
MPRPPEPRDLLRLKLVSDGRLAPDGSRVAYVLTSVDEARDGYRSRIWIADVEGGGAAQATPLAGEGDEAAGRDWAPRWSPDGSRLAFLRDRPIGGGPEAEGDVGPGEVGRGPRLWLASLTDGEARPFPGAPPGSSPAAWSPDGRRVAVTAPVFPEPAPELVRRAFQGPAEEYAKDARVIATPFYREDGEGYRKPLRRRIVVLGLDGRATTLDPADEPPPGRGARHYPPGAYDDGDPAWSPDGRFLAFTRRRPADTEDGGWGRSEIWIASPETGEGWLAARLAGPASHPAWFPPEAVGGPGYALAFFGHGREAEGSTNVHVFRLDLAPTGRPSGPARDLVPTFDRSVGNHNRSYERASPPALQPAFGPGGRWVLFVATDGGEQPIWAVPADGGEPVRVGPGERRVVPSFSVSADGRRLAAVVETATSVGDVHVVDLEEAGGELLLRAERRLTAVNDELYRELSLAEPERIECRGADGWPVEGWLLLPPGRRPGERVPLVLNVHGGPHGTWGYTLMFENQMLAGAGFAVVYGNPRGSQGYGQAFTAAVDRHWGEGDFRDLEALVEAALGRPEVDPERLGVMGNSYGGYMANWIVAHDPRFRAAVTQGTISNRASDFGTSDFGFVRDRLSRDRVPWNREEPLWLMSPLRYVENVRAAVLILHGEDDLRCPVEQAEQWYTALMCLGLPVAMVRYPGESHGFTRTGRPSHRVDRLRRHLDWFLLFLREGGSAGAGAERAEVGEAKA